jgi:Carboxypeptidase regulatory-like domain
MKGRSLTFTLVVLAVLAFAWPAAAQLQRGAIYGTVVDNTGAVLPGVNVTLSSPVSAPHTVVSGGQGEFRFGELDPGNYTLTASLQGFAPFSRKNIVVAVGSDVQIPVQMALAGVKQEVTVTAATPVLNEKEHGNSTTFGEAALNDIPTARDPWVLMQQVPGVLIDRINVGGSESGQQSTISARGDNGNNTMWNIDGVTITDMGAIGSSPTYYNFDVFQEAQFTTGSTDPRQQTGALGINLVTKRGTNDFHGLGRYFFDNHNLQTTNLPSNIVPCPPGVTVGVGCYKGNSINQIADYGGDIGGPILKNKLWFWGSLARNDIRMFAITGAPDNTKLDSASAKVDFQATPSNHANFFYYRGDKVKIGRNAGVTRPPETTWNQGGPTDIYKFEDTHTFGAHLMVAGRYAHVTGGFFLTPQGGLNANVFNDESGAWHGSYIDYSTNRPQDQVNADASYFRGMHEVKVGFQYRRTPITSASQWPNGYYSVVNAVEPGISSVTLTRANAAAEIQNNTGFYVGDTISLNRVTIDASLRYDRQRGFNSAATVPANPLAPALLPSISFPDQTPLFTFNSWSPRIGATMHVNDKTNVRASYAMFEGQLPAAYMFATNPVQLSAVTYAYADPGNHVPTASNIDFSTILSSYGFDPANPTLLQAANTVDSDLKAPRTHSVVVALDREVMANFALSTSFGYAYTNRIPWQTYPGLTTADFVQVGTIGTINTAAGQISSNTPIYDLAPGIDLPPGSLLQNRPGYHQRYWNWDITATKRLADKWMFRGSFTVNNNQEYFTDPALSIQDPTALSISGSGSVGAGTASHTQFGQTTFVQPNVNGGVIPLWGGNASGSKQDVFLHAKWNYSLMGMYQFGWGINASAAVYGHQGYPTPSYVIVNRGGLGSRSPVLIDPTIDDTRNPNVNIVDLRAEKSFTFRGVSIIGSADVFNAFNSNTTLQVTRNAGTLNLATGAFTPTATFAQAREIVSPRIFRLGVRVQF